MIIAKLLMKQNGCWGCIIMNKLENLIQTLCPDGVEYKTLGEVLSYEQPSKYIVTNTDYKD